MAPTRGGASFLKSIPSLPHQLALEESFSMRAFGLFATLAVSLFAFVCVSGLKSSDPPGVQLKAFADSFLKSLDDDQMKLAVMDYDSKQRVDWHFIPKKTRKGLVLSDMNSAQRTAALRLLRAALSEAGYDKASKIMLLEGVLRELEGPGGANVRDPQRYYVTIFGEPSESDPWGLSIEGHHLSINFSMRGGKVVDSTPQFFAANPATIKNDVGGPLGKGTRVLKKEEQLAFRLVRSLSEKNREAAIIAEKCPKEVRFAGTPQTEVDEPEGVAYGSLSEDSQKLLKQLVRAYTDSVPEKIAKQRRDNIQKNGWDNVHFAWAGATKPGIGHYYRIRGKEFLVEFVNKQPDAAGNPANHIHCYWRDVTGDFDLPAK